MPATRRHLLIAIVAFLALVACGILIFALTRGGDEKDAKALLAETFGPGHPMRSGRLDLRLAVSGSGGGLAGPIDLSVSGPFQSAGGKRIPRFSLEFELAGQEATVGVVSTGSKGYVTVNGQPFELSKANYSRLERSYADTQRADAKRRSGAPALSALGIAPSRWLANARVEGRSEIAGTEVTHISGDIDVAALLEDLDRLLRRSSQLPAAARGTTRVPAGLSRAERAAITRSLKSASVDVYSGREDRTLRRIRLALDLDVPASDRETLGGLERLRVLLDVSIADLGRPQRIVAPKDARPISELLEVLSSLGSSSGTSGGGTSTTETEPPPSSSSGSSQQPYLDCLQEAGESVAALQKCAELLDSAP